MLKKFLNKKNYLKNQLKFYYYSPEKLKLVQLKGFIFKVTLFFSVIIFSTLVLSVYLGFTLGKSRNSTILENQSEVVRSTYENELKTLNSKYAKLSQKFNELISSSNQMRIAVNLEELDVDNIDFGIGGSNFRKTNYNDFIENDYLGDIYDLLNGIEVKLNYEKGNYQEIQQRYIENEELFSKIPALKPVASSYGDRFGMRFHPILKRRKMHYGLDFLSNTGEEVLSPGDGVVNFIGTKGGYGKVIRIDHGFGYQTLYAHLSNYKVKKGQKVKRGEVIALTGNSGSLSTGPHLHYEVRHNGISLNPRNFIFEDVRLFDN